MSEVTPVILNIVAQYIGSVLRSDGRADILEVNVESITWEEYVLGVYDVMLMGFIIMLDDVDNFNTGIEWIRNQNWKK